MFNFIPGKSTAGNVCYRTVISREVFVKWAEAIRKKGRITNKIIPTPV